MDLHKETFATGALTFSNTQKEKKQHGSMDHCQCHHIWYTHLYILTMVITISHVRDTGDIQDTHQHELYTSIKQNIKTTCVLLEELPSLCFTYCSSVQKAFFKKWNNMVTMVSVHIQNQESGITSGYNYIALH